MLEWSLEAFGACPDVVAIIVAAPREVVAESGHSADDRQVGPQSGPTSTGERHPSVQFVEGGATRAESVGNALALVETEVVAIHDAARPLVTPALIQALVTVLDANPEAAAAIAAAPLTDTVKRSGRSRTAFRSHSDQKAVLDVEETLDRGELWGAQTPQVFRTVALREALEVDEATRDAATDEAMLVEQAGGIVLLHHCKEPNLKVTTPGDLRVAEMLLRDR